LHGGANATVAGGFPIVLFAAADDAHPEDVVCHGHPDNRPVPGIETAQKGCAQEREDAELDRIMRVEYTEFGRTKKIA